MRDEDGGSGGGRGGGGGGFNRSGPIAALAERRRRASHRAERVLWRWRSIWGRWTDEYAPCYYCVLISPLECAGDTLHLGI
ncbi:hypothetical protein Hypma_011311 [Hypsizygus marmoreus]|uniref:Uncharacterized protein n=1 Tax=Hypsizygus marmoreus TaxID=39966 RepID=A0A369JLY4_HYPMA|nr:hypothetical protein Hypma_011311 [Hypsizygus marmoreus]